ncbi:MAG: DMT family transporter [Hyphomicrobiales bacterium]|nr:DMT family transporter [Hyphomicrobiales bacterium]
MQTRDWLLLVLLSVLWGGTFLFVAIALPEVPPLTLVLARCVIAAVALLALLAALGFRLPDTTAGWRRFAVMAILNNIIPFSLIFWAQTHVPAGLASVLNATTPLMALLVARIIAGEAMAPHRLVGVLVGISGVGVLVGPEALGTASSASLVGMLAVLGATLSYGLSGLWGRRLSEYPAPVSAASQMICSSVMLLPIAASLDRFWTLPVPSVKVLVAIAALGILSTALAYILFFRIMQTSGSLNVMLVTLLIPVTGVGLGYLVLGETLTLRQGLGAVVIGLSLLVIDGRVFGIKPPSKT